MNRYPLWKYILIGVALLFGLVYTAPNFFGEVPAVQISPARTTLKADNELLEKVEGELKNAKIVHTGIFLDATSVKVRLQDTDTQLRVKDLLQSHFGEDYTVALNLLPNTPSWLTAIGAVPMYLGLDLRGGVHFMLQVDMKSAISKKLDSSVSEIRSLLREKRVQYSGVTREGARQEDQRIVVKFRDRGERDKGAEEIGRSTSEFDLRPQDDAGAGEYRLVAVLKQQALIATEKATVEQNITTLRNRVNELGVSEPIVQQQGTDRIVVQLPGIQDTARAKDILGRTATLEFRMVEAQMSNPSNRDYDPDKVQAAINGNPPIGTELLYEVTKEGGRERKEALVLGKRPVITGDRLSKAAPTLDQRTSQPVVSITLDGQGANSMRSITREGVGRRMAVLLVEKGKPEVLTAPVIQGEFAGNFQISGNFTTQSATNLALLLRAGALAAPMEIVEERTVGPSLGADNIRIGVQSVWMGFAAIAFFMILYYRVFGLISIFALATNLLLLVALLSVQLIQATLTLPGIAAIALALGMAIDANVLINERIREELRNGNTPQAAISAGYERAWATILDSNVTTLIAGLALLAFGSGPVRGFAVVHCLGILTSMFSAVVVSRGVVNLTYGRQRRLNEISIGQVWKPAVAGKV